KKGTFSEMELNEQSTRSAKNERRHVERGTSERPGRLEVLERLVKDNSTRSVVVATTGFTGRELGEVEDLPNHFYMVGSMGCASSLGLGLALSRPDRKVVVVDGDGAMLMRMGNLPTIAYYQPDNFFHLLLDNNSHDSTGGQLTVSHIIDFIGLSSAL